MNKHILVTVIVLLLIPLSFIPIHAVQVTSTSLMSTTSPQKTTFAPKGNEGKTLQDLGTVTWQTNLNGFIWNSSKTQSIQLSIPTVAGIQLVATSILFNSSLTSFQFTNLNLFFRPNSYQTKITIQGTALSSEQICFNIVTIGGSIFHNSTDTFATLGNLRFDWGDIPSLDNPTFSNSQLCFTVLGTFLIDPIALDGSAFGNSVTGTSCPTSSALTTSASPDIIIAVITTDTGVVAPFSTVSSISGGGLTWISRGSIHSQGVADNHYRNDEIWYAKAASTLSGVSFTATLSNSAFCNIEVFGISGADQSTIFDPNVSLPASGIANPNWPLVSTTNANDFIFSFGQIFPVGTAGSGFTAIDLRPGQAFGVEYKIVSATQSGLSASFSSSTNYVSFADAVCASGSCGSASPLLLILKVSPSPTPEGGAIFIGAATTISSSTTLTISSSSTFTVIAQEFGGYIYSKPLWTGFISIIQDTINPTQTVTVTATALVTQSSTLTANFSTGGGGGGEDSIGLVTIVLLLITWLLLMIRVRRK